MDNEIAPMVKDFARKIVEDYAKEQGWEIERKESTIKKSELEIDQDGNLLEGSQEDLNTVAGFFKNIGKKRGMNFQDDRDSRIEKITKNKDIQQEIKNLTNNLTPDSSDDEKSRAAYTILTLKLKLTGEDFGSDIKNLIKSCEKDLDRLDVKTKGTPAHKTVTSVKEQFQRTLNLTEKSLGDIKRLNTLSEDEFMAQDYESRGKYLTHVKKELDSTLNFLKEEQESIKRKLLNVLANQIDLGDHIGTVLG